MNKLSIITINKNNKLGLKKTITSVISQTCFDKIQFIVVDGNSVDGSKEILDPSLYTVISEDDNGIFDAMNKGVKYVNGEYCLFLNSSDYFCSNTTIQDIYERLNGTDVISFGINYYPCNAIRRPSTSDGKKESMVQRVYRQIRKYTKEKIFIVAPEIQRELIKQQLGDTVEFVSEPCRRGTYNAIQLACSRIMKHITPDKFLKGSQIDLSNSYIAIDKTGFIQDNGCTYLKYLNEQVCVIPIDVFVEDDFFKYSE